MVVSKEISSKTNGYLSVMLLSILHALAYLILMAIRWFDILIYRWDYWNLDSEGLNNWKSQS